MSVVEGWTCKLNSETFRTHPSFGSPSFALTPSLIHSEEGISIGVYDIGSYFQGIARADTPLEFSPSADGSTSCLLSRGDFYECIVLKYVDSFRVIYLS